MQSHLVIDFPIKDAADAKALTEALPPLMPGLAKVQDDLGTVHFSRFLVEGDEKLLFVSDIDGAGGPHLERLAESADSVLDAIFEHVDDPPATPVTGNRQSVIEWLQDHVREPVDTYFAYEDASVQDIKACARSAGFTGTTSQDTLLLFMSIKPEQGLALLEEAEATREQGYAMSDAVGTLHFSDWVLFEDNHLGFFTIYDGDFEKYIQYFAEKTSLAFNTIFPHIVGAPPTPVEKNAHAFYEWALENNHPSIGFYSAYPGLSVIDIRALLADASESKSASSG
jgi:hypothetical protein